MHSPFSTVQPKKTYSPIKPQSPPRPSGLLYGITGIAPELRFGIQNADDSIRDLLSGVNRQFTNDLDNHRHVCREKFAGASVTDPARTTAGRSLDADRSEKGSRTRTTWPAAGETMLPLPRGDSSLPRVRTRSRVRCRASRSRQESSRLPDRRGANEWARPSELVRLSQWLPQLKLAWLSIPERTVPHGYGSGNEFSSTPQLQKEIYRPGGGGQSRQQAKAKERDGKTDEPHGA